MPVKSSIKKGFTLVEMLIVIVIIGILAAALIPRFSQARERANDTARKANLQSIAAVLVAYQIDKGSYPAEAGSIANLEDELTSAGLSSVPRDPDSNRQFEALVNDSNGCAVSPAGQYLYVPVRVRGVANAGFVLAAGTQTEGGSNWIFDENKNGVSDNNFVNGCISETSELRDLTFCDGQFTDSATSIGDVSLDDCIYYDGGDVLRYIYAQ